MSVNSPTPAKINHPTVIGVIVIARPQNFSLPRENLPSSKKPLAMPMTAAFQTDDTPPPSLPFSHAPPPKSLTPMTLTPMTAP